MSFHTWLSTSFRLRLQVPLFVNWVTVGGGALLLVTLTIFSGCSPSHKQAFTTAEGRYLVYWSGDHPTRIYCTSTKIPGGNVTVEIQRRPKQKKVTINNKRQTIWSREVFLPGETRGSSAGVVYHEESQILSQDYVETQEWRVETNNVVIYREELYKDRGGRVVHEKFFGPLGAPLDRATGN